MVSDCKLLVENIQRKSWNWISKTEQVVFVFLSFLSVILVHWNPQKTVQKSSETICEIALSYPDLCTILLGRKMCAKRRKGVQDDWWWGHEAKRWHDKKFSGFVFRNINIWHTIFTQTHFYPSNVPPNGFPTLFFGDLCCGLLCQENIY